MTRVLAYYIIVDNGDGSASVEFFETKEAAQEAEAKEMQDFGIGTLSEGVETLTTLDLPFLEVAAA